MTNKSIAIGLLSLASVLLAACSKDDPEVPKPNPEPVDPTPRPAACVHMDHSPLFRTGLLTYHAFPLAATDCA